jgi:hypothetical protein
MNDRSIVGCVTDLQSKYLEQSYRLLVSWRQNAGQYAQIPFHVVVIGEIPEHFRALCEPYSVQWHCAESFASVHPPSNKLRFLETCAAREADRVVLLDCDIVLVGAPDLLFSDADFLAKPADFATVPMSIFQEIFEAYDVVLPPTTMLTTISREKTIPYYNAGVLSFSREAMRTLVPRWLERNRDLAVRIALLGDAQGYLEQATLSLALAEMDMHCRPLDETYNFPAHCVDPVCDQLLQRDPVIIHYHHRAADGLLDNSPYPKVQAAIDVINSQLGGAWYLAFKQLVTLQGHTRAAQQALEDELKALRNSRSWRLTAPLRRLYRSIAIAGKI